MYVHVYTMWSGFQMDQHFAVKCLRLADEVTSDDDDNGPNELSRPHTGDAPYQNVVRIRLAVPGGGPTTAKRNVYYEI